MIPYVEILERAHTGPICKEKEWDIKVIPSKVKEKLREHGLENTCDRENPVNTDNGLADEFWHAGFELAVELGMLCVDTSRIIKFTEQELRMVLRDAPSKVILGKGEDLVIAQTRKPEDTLEPTTAYGAMGIKISNDIFIPLLQSIASCRLNDILIHSVPALVYGKEIRSGTPYETLAVKLELFLEREATRRAGRPHMPIWAPGSSATEYGEMGIYGTRDGPDLGIVLPITELKTSYSLMHKTIHTVINHEGIDGGNSWSMIGGYVGPAEGAAVAAIASTILNRAVHLLTFVSGNILDIRYLGNSGREAIWAMSVLQQAQNRNTHLLTYGLTSQLFGPCTSELLYETAAIVVDDVTSGVSTELGTRPTGCKYPDYASGLENTFAAEVTKAAAGMKREHANEIVKAFLPKYEDRLQRPNKGKSFTECFD
ncbi:MAG: hypothetical protein APU95_00715, partial [Hadesarchaea archaeon YNP_N21]